MNAAYTVTLLLMLFIVPTIGCWIGLIVTLPKLFSCYEYERSEYLGLLQETALATVIIITIIETAYLIAS